MMERVAARWIAPFLASLAFAGCGEAPTAPQPVHTPAAPAMSVLPDGMVPYVIQNIWSVEDQNGDPIWQDLALASLTGAGPFTATGGYFTLSAADPGGQFKACVPYSGGGSLWWWYDSICWPLFWDVSSAPNPPSRGCGSQPYPLGMWYSELRCYQYNYEYWRYGIFTGTRYRVVAAPTAPGGLFFRRWEITIGGVVQPCAEGTASLTCTVTATQDYAVGAYPAPGPYFRLVYGPQFPFSGFLAPVDNPPTLNSVKAGRAVPVKFGLGGDQGLDILAGTPTSHTVPCEGTAPVVAIEETATAGGSALTYDATSDTYTYVWKTEKAWAGTCRAFTLGLVDETSHVAIFQFE